MQLVECVDYCAGAGKYIVTCAHRFSRAFFGGKYEAEQICGKCFLLKGEVKM